MTAPRPRARRTHLAKLWDARGAGLTRCGVWVAAAASSSVIVPDDSPQDRVTCGACRLDLELAARRCATCGGRGALAVTIDGDDGRTTVVGLGGRKVETVATGGGAVPCPACRPSEGEG